MDLGRNWLYVRVCMVRCIDDLPAWRNGGRSSGVQLLDHCGNSYIRPSTLLAVQTYATLREQGAGKNHFSRRRNRFCIEIASALIAKSEGSSLMKAEPVILIKESAERAKGSPSLPLARQQLPLNC